MKKILDNSIGVTIIWENNPKYDYISNIEDGINDNQKPENLS